MIRPPLFLGLLRCSTSHSSHVPLILALLSGPHIVYHLQAVEALADWLLYGLVRVWRRCGWCKPEERERMHAPWCRSWAACRQTREERACASTVPVTGVLQRGVYACIRLAPIVISLILLYCALS
jgi:hypothetical protein